MKLTYIPWEDRSLLAATTPMYITSSCEGDRLLQINFKDVSDDVFNEENYLGYWDEEIFIEESVLQELHRHAELDSGMWVIP